MHFYRPLVALTLLLGATGLYQAAPAWATLYRCTETDGTEVFTDSPAPLHQCMTITPDASGAPDSGTPPPRSDLQRRQFQERSSRPPARFSSRIPRPPRQPQDQVRTPQLSESPSAGPEDGPDMTPPPSTSQPCRSVVNPLNPLLSVPCPPS